MKDTVPPPGSVSAAFQYQLKTALPAARRLPSPLESVQTSSPQNTSDAAVESTGAAALR